MLWVADRKEDIMARYLNISTVTLDIAAKDSFSPKVLRIYFEQSRVYHSSHRNDVLTIAAMAPQHCANAAERLLREAEMWAQDCDVQTNYPQLWMTTTALFQALAKRGAQEA